MHLEQIAELLRTETGIELKESQRAALEAAIDRVSKGAGAERFLAELADPVRGPATLLHLIDQVTIQETYFFREPRELEAIDWHQLLANATARGSGTIRVWAAACATGEEVYSLAALAYEVFGHGTPPVSVLGTDISPTALHKAERGSYSERSVRTVDPERRQRFLHEEGRHHTIGAQLRSAVHFRRHNLVTEPAPPPGETPFDLILCRNVLIYFGAETVERVLTGLESALQPGGQLILGVADRLTGSAHRLADPGDRTPAPAPRLRGRKLRRPLGSVRGHRPLGRRRGDSPELKSAREQVERALEAANVGELTVAIERTSRLLADDPFNAEAYFVHGLAELALGDAEAAATSLRRALYIDPSFALAAFQLGRAQDLRGDSGAARRAYGQALRTLDPDDDRHPHLLAQVDIGDIAAACRARLQSGR